MQAPNPAPLLAFSEDKTHRGWTSAAARLAIGDAADTRTTVLCAALMVKRTGRDEFRVPARLLKSAIDQKQSRIPNSGRWDVAVKLPRHEFQLVHRCEWARHARLRRSGKRAVSKGMRTA